MFTSITELTPIYEGKKSYHKKAMVKTEAEITSGVKNIVEKHTK